MKERMSQWPNRQFRCLSMISLLCAACLFAGCSKEVPPPVNLSARVKSLEEDVENKSGKVTINKRKKVQLAELEILTDGEHKGKKFFVVQIVHDLADNSRLIKSGDRLDFQIDPRIIDQEEPCELEKLWGLQFAPN